MKKLVCWLRLARLPFLLVGVMPYLLGVAISFRVAGVFNIMIVVWGLLGVILIMLATYFAGEYWDFKEDSISMILGHTAFAGGSGVIQQGLIPRHHVRYASWITLSAALVVGIILQFIFGTGKWTLALGMIGVIGGFFYSTRPLRWVDKGWGEIWIALCYGWLPIATGYYLLNGDIIPVVFWLAIPVGLTIFNVIVLNEFLDYDADRSTGKRNLLVRVGPVWAARFYVLANIAGCIASIYMYFRTVPCVGLFFYLPILFISLILAILTASNRWRRREILNRMCAGTIVVNLGTTFSLIMAYIIG